MTLTANNLVAMEIVGVASAILYMQTYVVHLNLVIVRPFQDQNMEHPNLVDINSPGPI